MYKKDGSFYIGQFDNGAADGHGFYITPSGDYYEGKFADDKAKDKHGKYVAGEVVYEGSFEDNTFNGEGVETGPDYSFKGVFEDGSRKNGVLIWK